MSPAARRARNPRKGARPFPPCTMHAFTLCLSRVSVVLPDTPAQIPSRIRTIVLVGLPSPSSFSAALLIHYLLLLLTTPPPLPPCPPVRTGLPRPLLASPPRSYPLAGRRGPLRVFRVRQPGSARSALVRHEHHEHTRQGEERSLYRRHVLPRCVGARNNCF